MAGHSSNKPLLYVITAREIAHQNSLKDIQVQYSNMGGNLMVSLGPQVSFTLYHYFESMCNQDTSVFNKESVHIMHIVE